MALSQNGLTSRRVDASKQHQTLQTSKTSKLKNKPKGEGLPSPYPLPPPGAAQLFVRLASSGPSWTGKICRQMTIFCLWARLGRTQGDMICITSAIRRLYAAFGVHFSLSSHCLPLFS